jgi:hypothetical protein
MEYLLKSSACLIGFYGLYFFIFRNFTFHSANRFYLLFSIIFSLLIPFLSHTQTDVEYMNSSLTQETSLIEYMPNELQPATNNLIQTNPKEEQFWSKMELFDILALAYFVGAIVSLLLFVKNLISILRIIKTEPFENYDGNLKIYNTNKFEQNSSFFNNVFISEKGLNPHEKSLIISHENLHSRKYHTIDLLSVGMAKCVFWFNPIIYFLQKSLKETHEYEVDSLMTETFDGKEYALLLLKLGVSEDLSILNQMSKKPLSKRIEFLFRSGTPKSKKYVYLLILPLVLLSLFAFSKKEIVKVYKEKNNGIEVAKIEVKAYPLSIKNDRDYATWGVKPSLKMTSTNISLNSLTTVKYNGYRYEVNPISLTENTIGEVNKELKKRNLALVATEREIDLNGEFTKLGFSIKHLKTGKNSVPVVFDMTKCREQGQNGAFFVIETYDQNFDNSQINYFFGSPNLLINKSLLERKKHNTFNINSASSIISHSSNLLTYVVYPDKFTIKAAEEAKEYFQQNGIKFELKNYKTDAAGRLTKVKIAFGSETREFDLNTMRHWLKLKSEANAKPTRMDESMVFEANLKNGATSISINDFSFKSSEKSGKYEIVTGSIYNDPKPKKVIRTVYETNFLGENPLVIINGEEYPAEILTRLNTENSSSSYSLPNNPRTIEKYGEKAKDGYYELNTQNDFVIHDSKKLKVVRGIIEKHLYAPKKRVLRISYKDIDKKNYEQISFHREDKTSVHFGITIPKDGKVLLMLDNEIVTENDLENLTTKIVSGSCGEKIDEKMIKFFGEKIRGYDGFIMLKTK